MTPFRAEVAILIPCHNEEKSIGILLSELIKIFNTNQIFVGLNACTDKTGEIVKKFDVNTISENRLGKGNIVRTLFESVESKIYILLDGDATYGTERILEALQYFSQERLTMLIGKRVLEHENIYPRGHLIGNKVMTFFTNFFLGTRISDSLSGFRIFSRGFVKTFTLRSEGFEIESDFNSHAAELKGRISEFPVRYSRRPEGSFSKLSTFSDGFRITRRIIKLSFRVKPLQSFIMLSLPWLFASVFGIYRSLNSYFQTGEIPNYPSLIGGVSSFQVFLLLVTCGIIIDRNLRYKSEIIQIFSRTMH